jgi:hypothetical protein
MLKNKKLGCLSLLLLSPMAMAMQPLDDKSLSAMTGQDGLTVSVNISKIDFKQAAIIDTDGFTNSSATLPGKAALVMATSPGGPANIGVDFVQTFNANGSIQNSSSELFKAVIDSDAGTGTNGAFANIALSLGGNVNGIRIRPFSVYLAPDVTGVISSLSGSAYTRGSIFSTGTTLKSANIKELLRVSNNIDILFNANKPKMNIQLGSVPQGKMVMFSGAIDSICGSGNGCNMMLVSDYLTSGDVSTSPVGVGFDFQFTGHNGSPFSLDGFYAGVEGKSSLDNGGFVFGNAGESSKFDLKLNNVSLGNTGSSAIETFNSLPNASIGNIGAIGASVTNLKVKVSGM